MKRNEKPLMTINDSNDSNHTFNYNKIMIVVIIMLMMIRNISKHNNRPDPKLPFKGVVSVAGGELFADEGV